MLDRETGARIWERQLTPGSANGGIMATAAFADGVLYVASNDGTSGRLSGPAAGPRAQTTFALDASSGDVLWETDLEPATFGAVSLANGVLYVPTIDGTLHALDAANGKVLFSDKHGEVSAASGPTISNGMVFVGNGWQWTVPNVPGGLTAYALPDGT